MTLRTTDTDYGQDYWDTLDGGAGYQDSVMWQDIAHEIFEVLVADKVLMHDHSGQQRVIDVGCAFGYLIRHLRRRGIEAFGLDVSDYALERAPSDVAPHLQWFDLTAESPPFYGYGTATIATCFETMEHIPEQHTQRALTHIHNMLVPDGMALFTICVEEQPDTDSDPTHVNIKPRAWWEQRIQGAGFHRDRWCRHLEEELQYFWLFAEHQGVFVASALPKVDL